MHCVMCDKEEQSDPKVESNWTYIEVDGKGYYVCPDHIPVNALPIQYELAYGRIFKKILSLPRE